MNGFNGISELSESRPLVLCICYVICQFRKFLFTFKVPDLAHENAPNWDLRITTETGIDYVTTLP